MDTYEVVAHPEGDYWELEVDGVGVTQSRSLSDADAMVRDYLALRLARDMSAAEIVVHPFGREHAARPV